jgi:D-alanyl-D-alanine carboxypeptidase
MDIDKDLEAPIKSGQQVGVVNVTLNGDKLRSMPLIALKPVERGNFIQVAKDYLLKLIN